VFDGELITLLEELLFLSTFSLDKITDLFVFLLELKELDGDFSLFKPLLGFCLAL
jgi:hypothetical protein